MIALAGGALYAGGAFGTIDGQSGDAAAGQAQPGDRGGRTVFAAAPDQPVDALWHDGARLFAGGEFSTVQGQTGMPRLAKLDPANGRPPPPSPRRRISPCGRCGTTGRSSTPAERSVRWAGTPAACWSRAGPGQWRRRPRLPSGLRRHGVRADRRSGERRHRGRHSAGPTRCATSPRSTSRPGRSTRLPPGPDGRGGALLLRRDEPLCRRKLHHDRRPDRDPEGRASGRRHGSGRHTFHPRPSPGRARSWTASTVPAPASRQRRARAADEGRRVRRVDASFIDRSTTGEHGGGGGLQRVRRRLVPER